MPIQLPWLHKSRSPIRENPEGKGWLTPRRLNACEFRYAFPATSGLRSAEDVFAEPIGREDTHRISIRVDHFGQVLSSRLHSLQGINVGIG